MTIKNTKTALLSVIVLLTLLMFFQACEKSGNSSLVGIHLLKQQEVKETTESGKTVVMAITEINDSRCPINADCVTAGFAKIKIKFTDEIKEQTIEICKGGCYVNALQAKDIISLNGNNYEVVLEEITPYPTLDKIKQETQVAKIVIAKTTR